ncbi:hypothetical protein LVJ94_49165 [Pendulispora rubella]|uniref:Uncharacterized protein n=1 Tax=Pendulispora rubella TaxID=2741070 RepID=A0ABZ2L1N8_9BACT
MRTRNYQSLEDPFVLDECTENDLVDPLAGLPEIKNYIALDRPSDEERGVRSVLERPDALARLWRRLRAA